jgi:uncharacterized membrane-anchored protein
MFVFLVAVFAIVGAGAGFLLSRADHSESNNTVKSIVLGALGGAVVGAGLWLSFVIFAFILRIIFWLVLLVAVAAVVYVVYRKLSRRA